MNRIILWSAIWILTAGVYSLAVVTSPADDKLVITLKPDVTVDNNQVCLSHIADLTGPRELVEKAKNAGIGMLTAKGQMIYADRNTILSVLAGIGIPSRQVELTGAQTAQIHKHEKYVQPGQLVETAKAYLEKQLTGQKIGSIQPVGIVAAVVLNDPNMTPEISAVMSRYQTPGTRKITVSVSQGNIPVAQREIVFAVKYQVRHAVALRELLPGTVIQASDVRIEQIEGTVPEPAHWKEPFGLAAKRRISESSRIHPDWVGPAQAPTTIRRNQQVMVQLDTGSMHLSAPGQALDEGRAGELIRVKRGQRPDERIIYCTIQADGTVRPQI